MNYFCRDMLEKVNKFEEQFVTSANLDSPLRVNKLQPLADNTGSHKLLQMVSYAVFCIYIYLKILIMYFSILKNLVLNIQNLI